MINVDSLLSIFQQRYEVWDIVKNNVIKIYSALEDYEDMNIETGKIFKKLSFLNNP